MKLRPLGKTGVPWSRGRWLVFNSVPLANFGSVLMLRCKQFSDRPNVVSQSRFHAWGDPKRQSRVLLGVRLATLRTPKALKTVSVFPELPTLGVALWAVHDHKLQQALAVCQGETVCQS